MDSHHLKPCLIMYEDWRATLPLISIHIVLNKWRVLFGFKQESFTFELISNQVLACDTLLQTFHLLDVEIAWISVGGNLSQLMVIFFQLLLLPNKDSLR
jgi:hypothetical protein